MLESIAGSQDRHIVNNENLILIVNSFVFLSVFVINGVTLLCIPVRHSWRERIATKWMRLARSGTKLFSHPCFWKGFSWDRKRGSAGGF